MQSISSRETSESIQYFSYLCIRRWTKIGDADAMPETEARSQARSLLVSIRKGQENAAPLPSDIAFEAVAEEVFSYYRRHWKPRTLAVNLNYYQNNILPWFKGHTIAGITRLRCWNGSSRFTRNRPRRTDLCRCFRSSCGRPRSTDTARRTATLAKISSVTAAAARERFLSPDEIRRVVEVLSRYDKTRTDQAAVVRLLLLTGCRKSELLTLKWRDYREGKLFLRDSKNGPRTVWLSSAAREVLDRLPRNSAWVFPSRWGNLDHLSDITGFCGMCARKPICAMSGRTISGILVQAL